jgi:hypothetical protein
MIAAQPNEYAHESRSTRMKTTAAASPTAMPLSMVPKPWVMAELSPGVWGERNTVTGAERLPARSRPTRGAARILTSGLNATATLDVYSWPQHYRAEGTLIGQPTAPAAPTRGSRTRGR